MDHIINLLRGGSGSNYGGPKGPMAAKSLHNGRERGIDVINRPNSSSKFHG